ncbi:MAG: aggregation factor core [Pseudomonadota bacterium]
MTLRLTLAFALLASPAAAELTLSYVDSAPKDIFEITYTGTCPLPADVLRIDIGKAPAGLVFDTDPGGAGFNVSQPFEVRRGAGLLTALPTISDGATSIDLPLTGLGAGDVIRFTIDVDDTTSASRTRVSGSEMAGAMAALGAYSARFDASATAIIETPGCFG